MGCEIFIGIGGERSKTESSNSTIVATTLSGHYYAMPCRVRDETYVKVRGEWCYLYRAVDRHRKTLDFMLSEHRDEAAALLFLAKAIETNGLPKACVIDKSGANTAGPKSLNTILKLVGSPRKIRTYRSKYLNNIVEQDHRAIKRRIRPMMGFKAFKTVAATLDGIETANMIRKGLLGDGCPFTKFASLAG